MIDGVYRDELPVVYDPPKPKKILFTDEDLYRADTFGFGSIIGSITNKSSIAYSLLPLIERDYGKDSEEYKLTVSRLQQCCAAQSRQIDKILSLYAAMRIEQCGEPADAGCPLYV